MQDTTLEAHRRLARRLTDPACFPHAVSRVELLETHISTLLLAGDYAYKLKKPLDLGFLDFTTLEKRRLCCEEEIRLNGRFSDSLYQGVSRIAGSAEQPRMDGKGEVMEYAVRMRRFPQDSRLDQVLLRGELQPRHLDQLADDLATFHHTQAASDSLPTELASVDAQLGPVLENASQLLEILADRDLLTRVENLDRWMASEAQRLETLVGTRISTGMIRECHGDLHLENIVLLDDRPVPFDGIEFSAALRWIDVMNELAFLCMDLDYRGRRDASARILSRYLDATGDYDGIPLLRFYQVYRALVRAKIQAIRLTDKTLAAAEHGRISKALARYIGLAEACSRPGEVSLTVTCGLSGSGKSTAALELIQRSGAIRLRSDVERKRLYGLHPMARTDSAVAGDIYSRQATEATYAYLVKLAEHLLRAGWSVVVDAACLRRSERRLFQDLARQMQIPYRLLACNAPVSTLKRRLREREAARNDPSEADLAVLEHQLTSFEPPDEEELQQLHPDATWYVEEQPG